MNKTHIRIFELVIILMLIGVVFVFSMGFFIQQGQKTPVGFLLAQSSFALVGLLTICSVYFLDEKRLERLLVALFFIFLIACIILPFLPHSLVVETKGARRWLRIFGFSLAPLEFFKIGFIGALAWTYSRKFAAKNQMQIKEQCFLLLPSILVFCIIFGYIYASQNDLGQCVVCAVVLIFMAMSAGLRLKIVIMTAISGVFLGFLLIVFNPRRLERIKAYWGGIQDLILPIFPQDVQESLRIAHASEPYQISHSLNAISNGELFGQGFGLGVFKLGFLSEVHTDFILAGIAEEIGFFGFFAVGFLYIWLILSLFKIAFKLKTERWQLFSIGYATCLTVSFFMNLGGIISLIPLKGIAVPFLSYGGSSLIANCLAIGIILCMHKNESRSKK